MVQIECTLNLKDFILFSKSIGTKKIKCLNLFLVIGICGTLGFLDVYIHWPSVLGALALIVLLISIVQREWYPRPGGIVLGRRIYKLDSEGFSFIADSVTFQAKWDALVKAIETPQHFFLFLDTNFGLIVPKRCVPNEEIIKDLRALIDDKIKK